MYDTFYNAININHINTRARLTCEIDAEQEAIRE